MAGASLVHQEILGEHPDAPLHVYAIWLPMMPTDSRSEWDDDLLDDPRVTHLWDEDKVAGRFFAADYEKQKGSIQWDAYYLFDRGAGWGTAREKLVGSGRTVIAHSGDLKREVASVIGPG